MAWSFGDSFDLYAATADMVNGYWDSGSTTSVQLTAGRFTGSQALNIVNSTGVSLVKSSGVNDAVHHFVVAFRQTAALSGTTLGTYFQLSDGATNQVCIVFRSDGAILLTSATPVGTVLDTYTGAVTASNTWFGFEFEAVINNTTGSWAVRKNGNTSNDHALGSLNTRPGTNAYANKLTISMSVSVANQQLDDFLWRSDASSVAWMGDIRCIARMPAGDASVQFTRTPNPYVQTPFSLSTTNAIGTGANNARYSPFTAAYDGMISAATVSLGAGYTGNLKTSIFASSGSAPTTVLGSATVVVNPATGSNALTFGTPVNVVRGTQYWIGFASDTASGTWNVGSGSLGLSSTTAYASFPAASPTTVATAAVICSLTIATSVNYQSVNEPQQDAATSYVYDSTVNDADFYNIGTIASTPASTIMTTTRAYMQKSDAGTRTAAVQLKSGSTTVASPTLTLSAGSWQWAWRNDLVDPATSLAWTSTGVNNVTIGPVVIA